MFELRTVIAAMSGEFIEVRLSDVRVLWKFVCCVSAAIDDSSLHS